MKWNIKDMIGFRSGLLTVISCEGTDNKGIVRWLCKCDCGNTKIVPGYVLRRGASNSCGCRRREMGAAKLYRHGMARTRVYRIWNGMIRRCEEKNHKDYPRYGAMEIMVCGEWHDFVKFYDDMGEPPTNKHEIDRKDGTKGYSKDNCRWVTCQQQQRNRKSNVILNYRGESKTQIEWAEIYGMSRATLSARLKAGWPIEKALTQPMRQMRFQREV